MKKAKKIAVLAILAMILTMMPVQLMAATLDDDTNRIYGADRIETALQVCDAGWDTSSVVVLAAADQANLVDALAAAPLAGQENAPILLTYKDYLDSRVKAKIAALGAAKVYAIGAISQNVVNQIGAMGGVDVEVLKGASRWDTTRAINAELAAPEGCFVVGYNALADALSVSSFAAAKRYAIILADVNGRIPAGQSVLGSKVYVVGGSGLVADIYGATRLGGADRFETNRIILQSLDYLFNRVYVANGMNEHLVDSLVAAPLAARDDAPVILADGYNIPSVDSIRYRLNSATQLIALGGPSVVSDFVRDSIANGNSGSGANFAVKDIVPVSLNSFKVVFNQDLDETTAETESNYNVNGSDLDSDDSVTLLPDGRSVLVMVDQEDSNQMAPFNQYQLIDVEIKNDTIYNESKEYTAPEYLKEITMYDVTPPKLTSVQAFGNTKLEVEFSEPVNVQYLTTEVRSWKIDNANLSSMGLNSFASKAVDPTYGTAFKIANKVDLYFSSGLSSGSHTLKVTEGQAGINGWMVDGANFVIPESTKSFTVENVTGPPQVKSVKSVNNEIQVEFNRAMYQDPDDPNGGTGSALNIAYYDINDEGTGSDVSTSPLSSVPAFKSGSGDTIVKFKIDSDVIQRGLNIIELDKNIRDAWGNQLDADDNVRMTFQYTEDNTVPTVVSVDCINDTTVRIRFSKNMDMYFAQNVSNYSIKDSDGIEVLGKDGGGTARTVPADEDSDTVELIMPSGEYLRSSDYTLKIKNLRDTSLNGNFLDTYTTMFNGSDEYGPELEEVVVDPDDSTRAICFFSEKLDEGTVRVSNFGYRDGDNVWRDLPNGSTVSLDGTLKIVTVDFPSAYTVKTAAGGSNDKYEVNAIRVANVEDLDGNPIPGVAMTVAVQDSITSDYRPHFIQNSFCLYDDGDNVRAEFEMSQQLTVVDVNDFSVGPANGGFYGGVTANSGYTVGEKVILKFTTASKINAVRALGPNAYLYSVGQSSMRSEGYAGQEVLEFATDGYQVYDDQIRPRILPVDQPFGLTSEGGEAIVTIAFTEPIDGTITGYYDDDFIFSGGGTSLTVRNVTVDSSDPRIVKYDVGPLTGLPGGTITIRAVERNADIRDLKDRGPEDHNKYVPTTDDKYGRSITSDVTAPVISSVVANSSTNKVTVNFSEPVYSPGSYGDFRIESPYSAGNVTTPVAGTAWVWSGDLKSVDLTFGAANFKARDTYSLTFTSPGASKYKDLGNNYLATVTLTSFVNTAARDETFPRVMDPIGDGLNDHETIAGGNSVYVRFSEVLDSASKTAVTDALSAAKTGTGTLSYSWDDTTAKLTVTATGGSVTFNSDVTCTISDGTNINPTPVKIVTQ